MAVRLASIPLRFAHRVVPPGVKFGAGRRPSSHDLPVRPDTHADRTGSLIPPSDQFPFPAAFSRFLGHQLTPGEVIPLSREKMHELLLGEGDEDQSISRAMYAHADSVTQRFFGLKVHLRGLIEVSNECVKDCGYCGLRRGMVDLERYTMPEEEILEAALWAHDRGYGSVMLQAGERHASKDWVASMAHTIQAIRHESSLPRTVERLAASKSGATSAANCDKIDAETVKKYAGQSHAPESDAGKAQVGAGVALSLGELPKWAYEALHNAGGHRYLLRIETSNPDLYAALHPSDHSFDRRVRALRDLRDVGFQVGTGVMVGLPGQTEWDLAGDLMFFREMEVDMIGMGPYIPHSGTPVADEWWADGGPTKGRAKFLHDQRMFELTTRMNALARISLGNINIAATTALQAINPTGREIALNRGSNIMMPILTPRRLRSLYQLYDDKPCVEDSASDCMGCMSMRVSSVGKSIAWWEWGDPPAARGKNATTEFLD